MVILEDSVKIHPKAYGFVKNKSIVDNASAHLKKEYLLNIDLENFFPSISSARVYSLFFNYFRLDKKVAATLTNLCCHPNGFLPQGAPTSPIISNILCKTLDKELDRLAKASFGSSYSRYADDITFSSNKPFKSSIIKGNELGSTLENIIIRNGFQINYDKIRLQKSYQHQEVTGIIVNSKLNVDRRYIRKIRAMLFSIESNIDDLSIPISKFSKSDYSGDTIEELFMVIKGMINYVSMVRGNDDFIFEKLATRYNDLLEICEIKFSTAIYIPHLFENNVCVIKETNFPFKNNEGNDEFIDYGQGTGFLLRNYGIVSNYHVFEYLIELAYESKSLPDNFYIKTFFGKGANKLVEVTIDKYDKKRDLVLLKPRDSSLLNKGFELNETILFMNSPIKLIGYPEFSEGDELKVDHGTLLREINADGIKKYEINAMIYGGNSGGPVLNSDNKVIGVASEGKRITSNKVIPISNLDSL